VHSTRELRRQLSVTTATLYVNREEISGIQSIRRSSRKTRVKRRELQRSIGGERREKRTAGKKGSPLPAAAREIMREKAD